MVPGTLRAHPEVTDFFKQAGYFTYCDKLQSFHQQVSEVFALSYDGRKAIIGKGEFIVGEASIAKFTSLPRTGEYWFKTTDPADIEFRYYLQAQHKTLIWKKTFLCLIWRLNGSLCSKPFLPI
jgi:hypothetical protein